MIRRLIRTLLGRPSTEQLWSIGIVSGASPLELAAIDRMSNPALTGADVTDADCAFLADPFMVECGSTWFMFFELVDRKLRRGRIGVAKSDDGLHWTYSKIALDEPFHLSYPYVFEHDGDFYMVPETHQAKSVRLYRATRFPDRWELTDVLLKGRPFSDSSLFQHEGRWWMFSDPGPLFRFDTLALFSAPSLRGPWIEHPSSPVVKKDAELARPAGRVVVWDGRLVRFAQSARPRYGSSVAALEIVGLSRDGYRERVIARGILAGSGAGWNAHGMHHVDAHLRQDGTWTAAVDGWVAVPYESVWHATRKTME